MTVLENVELCDNGYVETRSINVAQKIKLRAPSYQAITTKYVAYTNSQESTSETSMTASEPTQNAASAPVTPTVEITKVVAINPAVAEALILLEINGRINSEGYKALKVKPSMCENMKKNSATEKSQELPQEMPTTESLTEMESTIENAPLDLELNEEQSTTKVSRNGATIAKIEKFTSEDAQTAQIASEEVTPVSPTVVEESSARAISRDVPLVAPERPVVAEENDLQVAPKEELEQPKSKFDNILNVSFANNISSLAELKEYLEQTARLKQEANQAKIKEEEAKKSAERAEQEAASSRDEFVKTAEKIAAHQESLIAQAEKSNEQAHKYDEKRGEYENEKAEYQKAINDMLAIMGDSEQVSKGKAM